MNRREFFSKSAALAAASGLQACGRKIKASDSQAHGQGGPTGSRIIYVRDKIPEIPYPAYKGKSYPAAIPDTLDLAERCKLALHGLTSMTDPAADYEIYAWTGFPRHGTIMAKHSYHDYNGAEAKWIEDLPLLRTASGSTENFSVDKKMMETLFHMLGPDGLYYIPVAGSPWSALRDPNEVAYADMSAKQIWNSWPNGRVLMALTCWYERNQDPVFKTAAERMVDGFAQIARYQDDYCYFLEKKFDNRFPSTDMPTGGGASVTQPTMFTGLALAYKVLKYQPARDLAEKHLRYIRGPAKWIRADGTWFEQVHFHGTTFGIQGLLEFGLAGDDHQLIELAQRAYEFGRSQGIPFIGWFPEGYPATHYHVETCHVADMTILAARLSAAGLGDYWEDVEHYVRNQLQSNQVVADDWLLALAKQNPQGDPPRAPYETADHVAKRMIGTFSGMASANGLFQPTSSDCCSGNGPRALCFAWKHIVEDKDGTLKVNLLLNRASESAEINSYLPYQGKLEIRMKAERNLQVRIPSWVSASQVHCQVNGKKAECALAGRYLDVRRVASGDTVRIAFPLQRKQIEVVAGKRSPAPFNRTYTLDMKGFNVVEIWPKDEPGGKQLDLPFYTRADYRQDKPAFKNTTRFAPECEPLWAD